MPLTSREREVLRLVCLGYTSTEIGEALVISVRTVESHRASLMRKLNGPSRRQLVEWARRDGLLAEWNVPVRF